MDKKRKEASYSRIQKQLTYLVEKSRNPLSRMATIAAVLHHKMEGYFWTGFYLLEGKDLVVGPYQGPVACLELERNKGVCWASINREETIIVPDVHKFPGHIACDSRSKTEIVVPVRNKKGHVMAVLDVDSQSPGRFDEVDACELEKVVELIYG